MNQLNSFLQSGQVQADVKVNVSFDLQSAILIAVFIMVAIVLSNLAVKAVLR